MPTEHFDVQRRHVIDDFSFIQIYIDASCAPLIASIIEPNQPFLFT